MNEAYLNGNLIREYDKSQLGDEPDALFAVDILAAAENNNPVYGVEGAWGYGYEKKDSNSFGDANFERIYEWDDKNQLIKTKDGLYTTYYVYNNEGDRVAKYTERSETLYFNKFWSWHIDPANAFAGGQLSKHIFLGDTRIVTKLSQETNNYIDAEKQRLYFYHSDHLGSASLITDYKGNEYERLEYTPYGELWVDLSEYTGSTYLPFKFSAKEMDSETGLYYYGARYLDSKYSLWKSTDPALGEYIPKAPINEQARQYNQNLPGMGGIFNPINANLYHYAGNNPVRYVDPDGRESAYVLATSGACHMGHGALFVKVDEYYYFFEINTTGNSLNQNDTILNEDKQGIDYSIELLCSLPIGFPTVSTMQSLDQGDESGAILRIFKTKTDLMTYLSRNKYDVVIEFSTTEEQDELIKNKAIIKGTNFGNYNLITNSCGIYARDCLVVEGTGIKPISYEDDWLSFPFSKSIPRVIGKNLLLANKNVTSYDPKNFGINCTIPEVTE